uniref:protein-serine/threonine phosphatase n=1 Tax=Arcella intermedia TaxID=1963864 RepID=A0A6B2LC18_9EUKA
MEDAFVANLAFGCGGDYAGAAKKKHIAWKEATSPALFGIFDGHGGARCSNFVSRRLPRVLFECSDFPDDIPKAMQTAFVETDKLWLKKAKSKKWIDGSTGIVGLVYGDTLYVANAGDSRGVLCQNGQVVAVSVDHKPTDPGETERITKYGGTVTKGRINGNLAVSRGFGDIEFKDSETLGEKYVTVDPDVRDFKITEQTSFLILACDGLWDTVTNEQAVELVQGQLAASTITKSENRDLFSICVDLVALAYKQESRDNISCLLVVFEHPKK